MAIARLKSFLDSGLKSVTTPLDRTAALEPEIGIRIVHSTHEKSLRVTVLGARHLPQNFGFTRVNAYVVKVKLMPGKEKFETTAKSESWPQWNEEFAFNLRKETKCKFGRTKVVEEEIGASKFLVATVYAILEEKPLIATEMKGKENAAGGAKADKKDPKKKDGQDTSSASQEASKNKFLQHIFGKSSEKSGDTVAMERVKIFDKRRTIGATTISLDSKNFNTKPHKPKHQTDVSTGDSWRPLKPISSGISGFEERRENKKGQLELSLCQEKSEKKDVSGGNLVLTLQRIRCSRQSMQEHEVLKGQLYIKMSVVENGKVTTFWKSDRFPPCITMNFNPASARVMAENAYEGALKDVSFVVKFVSKNKLGKKVTVGHFVIGPEVGGTYSEQWKQALAKPGQQIVKWQAFE